MKEKDKSEQLKVISLIVSSYDLNDETKFDAIKSIVKDWDTKTLTVPSNPHLKFKSLDDPDSFWPGLPLETRQTLEKMLK